MAQRIEEQRQSIIAILPDDSTKSVKQDPPAKVLIFSSLSKWVLIAACSFLTIFQLGTHPTNVHILSRSSTTTEHTMPILQCPNCCCPAPRLHI